MFNIYVLLLAFCYTPAGSVYGDVNTNENVSKFIINLYLLTGESAKIRFKSSLERVGVDPFVLLTASEGSYRLPVSSELCVVGLGGLRRIYY